MIRTVEQTTMCKVYWRVLPIAAASSARDTVRSETIAPARSKAITPPVPIRER